MGPARGKRRVADPELINGVMYILSTGCQWRALPKDLPRQQAPCMNLGLCANLPAGGTLAIASIIALEVRASKAALRSQRPRPHRDVRLKALTVRLGLASTATASRGKLIRGQEAHVLVDTKACCCTVFGHRPT